MIRIRPTVFRLAGFFKAKNHPVFPVKKLVTIELPDYIHDANSDFGTHYISEYSTKDGNANKVFFSCDATPVLDGFEPAINSAIQTIKISTPTPSGKREDLPAKVLSVSELY